MQDHSNMADIDTTAADSTGNGKKGLFLRWSRLTKTVAIKDGTGGLMGRSSISMSFHDKRPSTTERTTTKKILNEVSGYAAPGEILACMGPSGAGKTSLMNVLSGRSSYQGGVISINGEPTTAKSMKRLMTKVAYVKQADIFFGHLTVRDQFTYTALLRMPASTSTLEKHQEVDKLVRLLRLSKVADSPIMMVSGGERKRVNIGTELLTDPDVLLLDEPTSGLDSTTAVSLIELLQSYARQQGKTVITSIHQPSSAVFRSFDRLIMLSDGYVVYFGTPIDSLPYLRQLDLACPDGYNAADHWMDLLVVDHSPAEDHENGEEESAANADEGESNQRNLRAEFHGSKYADSATNVKLQKAWDGEVIAKQLDQALVETAPDDNKSLDISAHNSAVEGRISNTNKYNSTWFAQYRVLTHRALKNSRSAILTPLNVIKSLGLGLATGMIFWQSDYTEQNVEDIRSYFFFTMTFWVFDAMFTALAAFPEERVVIMKERSSGSYHLSAYFLAKTSSDMPVRILLPLLYMIVSYWMAGIENSFVTFIGSIGCSLLSVIAGEAIGLWVGASIDDFQQAITAMTVGALFLMLLGGFFAENPPAWIDWAKFLSPFKYSFDSALQVIFDKDVPCDGSGALEDLCNNGSDTGFASVEELWDFLGIQGTLGFNVGMLLVLCFVPRFFAYVALRMKKEGER
ncbi:hypothetical protein ACA910_016258 [Epithemia clementina (nom. ined.)]